MIIFNKTTWKTLYRHWCFDYSGTTKPKQTRISIRATYFPTTTICSFCWRTSLFVLNQLRVLLSITKLSEHRGPLPIKGRKWGGLIEVTTATHTQCLLTAVKWTEIRVHTYAARRRLSWEWSCGYLQWKLTTSLYFVVWRQTYHVNSCLGLGRLI